MEKYIHYGHMKFVPDNFINIKNRKLFTKPIGGLWASPVNAKFGWSNWCKETQFSKCDSENSFTFTLKENANVIHLYTKEDVLSLPMLESNKEWNLPWFLIDFEKLVTQEFDAIEVHISEDKTKNYFDGLYYTLYGWDCDSILIMNKDIIIAAEAADFLGSV